MNKKAIIILVIAITSLPVFSSGFGMVFNINYNIGASDFFNKSEKIFQSGGFNFLESKQNNLGIGFNAGVIIPINSRLSLIPAFTINFGYQHYEFLRQEKKAKTDIKTDYSLLIYSGEIKANYDIFRMKNGWRISLQLGINYNNFKSDKETNLKSSNFWGTEAGIGVRFFQLKHFGFQSFLIYKHSFDTKNFNYLTLKTGIIYMF